MNRRKKLTQAFKKKRQSAKAKFSAKQKKPYISKADRESDQRLAPTAPQIDE